MLGVSWGDPGGILEYAGGILVLSWVYSGGILWGPPESSMFYKLIVRPSERRSPWQYLIKDSLL